MEPRSSPSTLVRRFHVSVTARSRLGLEGLPFSSDGCVHVRGFYVGHMLAKRLAARGEGQAPAGDLVALATIVGVFTYVARLYETRVNPGAFARAVEQVKARVGPEALDRTCEAFAQEFGAGGPEGVLAPEEALRELVLLWLENTNPAAKRLRVLFSHDGLDRATPYARIVAETFRFFTEEPPFGPKQQPLLHMLEEPAIAEPHSLQAQLEFIRRHWGFLLDQELVAVLSALDLLEEEHKPRIPGPGPPPQMRLESLAESPEGYSVDRAWMPHLVLMAKNTLVWLAQLSRQWDRPITRLDQIPDQELDRLAGWGFTGLWLIGIWERSPASAKIKALCGDPRAAASAYSIYDYRVAQDLGGDEAFHALKERALRRGIRLGADMVPNHTGIVSRWVLEHPDWFLSLDHPPFPSYTFDGPDLSTDPRIGIYLEDHYYSKTDAAVVFKRVDRATGEVRYLYHGNDGTLMPWNDTAQLNYLNPQVREAVMNTILHVARMCPLIRFDAAMTLTKMHYQRLWFPEPGTGGAIPSRAEHGLTRDQFDQLMPREFWREVVDMVAHAAPDTLLLAEAFWLTEGYFVRTLGMHRVYNSAFMNMLREEDNASYRKLVKDTLAFDPEILRRYVNFMNNPDEEPAVAQFGKGGKYFGICTLMVTMPGLPMFGHGQVEGFAEKYGAEFTEPRWDEQVDAELVARHEREIFPLLKKRALFAGVEEFQFFDFVTEHGVDEHVFAYSNYRAGERCLVVYHNRWARTRGTLRMACPKARKDPSGHATLAQVDLVTALHLTPGIGRFVRCREHINSLEYLFSVEELQRQGLSLELGAYDYRVFMDFQEMQDTTDGVWESMVRRLGGRGVPSLDLELERMRLAPAHQAFESLMHHHLPRVMMEVCLVMPEWIPELLQTFEARLLRLCEAITDAVMVVEAPRTCARHGRTLLDRAINLLASGQGEVSPGVAESWVLEGLRGDVVSFGLALAAVVLHAVRSLVPREDAIRFRSDVLPDDLVERALRGLGATPEEARGLAGVLSLLEAYHIAIESLPVEEDAFRALVRTMVTDARSWGTLRVHEYGGVTWFSKEGLEDLLRWVVFWACVARKRPDGAVGPEPFARFAQTVASLAAATAYDLKVFLSRLEPPPGSVSPKT